MTVSPRDRQGLYAKLDQVLGPTHADHLMEILPLHPANELLTQPEFYTGLETLRTELKGEMAELRAELKGEMAELRAELKGEMAELRGDMTALRAEMRAELTANAANIKTSMNRWAIAMATSNTIAVVTALAT